MDRQKILHYRLQNQLLVGSETTTAEEVVKWMGAVQGQDYNPGLWAIHLRMPYTDREDILQVLSDLIKNCPHMVDATYDSFCSTRRREMDGSVNKKADAEAIQEPYVKRSRVRGF